MLAHRKNIYTQFGEDGIIDYLFKKLEIPDGGTCCEFGAWDGKHLSNTFRLVKDHKFRALYIEGDPVKYNDLLKTCEEYPDIIPVCDMVSDNLDAIFERAGFPCDIDLLSIDVDSIDYEIWRDTHKVNPKVVIIEPDNTVPSWVKKPVYSPAKGANYWILTELGREKGYTLVCNTSNLIFVRDDLMRDTIEVDDRLFPWHLEGEMKHLVFGLARVPELVIHHRDVINRHVPADQMEDFFKDFPKYCGGALLGYLGEEVRGNPVSIFRS
jgi:hypothetical protein